VRDHELTAFQCPSWLREAIDKKAEREMCGRSAVIRRLLATALRIEQATHGTR